MWGLLRAFGAFIDNTSLEDIVYRYLLILQGLGLFCFFVGLIDTVLLRHYWGDGYESGFFALFV